MPKDDLKNNSVRVGNGSGCFFQPMTSEYTYIITAKHLFQDEMEDEQGQRIVKQKAEGSMISIRRTIRDGDIWKEVEIPFIKNKNNYFEHENADIAILKIPYQDGLNMITAQETFEGEKGFSLCGFPETHNTESDKYCSYNIETIGASSNYYNQAQLFGGYQHQNIAGMSGGGILKLNQEGISIIGIQSQMGSSKLPGGGIGFVPIKYVREIIEYGQNKGKLEKLFPNTLSNFSFLRNSAFLLDVDAIDMEYAESTRIILLNKAQSIIDSEITPYGIRELFKERLLICEEDCHCLSFNAVWIAWLEFLTIMNIIKDEPITIDSLSEIFNTYRLKYVNTDDWTDADIRKEYGRSDYLGMPAGSTVIVCSKKPPKRTFKFPKGKLIDISKAYDKTGFRTDKGLDPFTSFDFVHLEYFKTKCIIHKIEEYHKLESEGQILNKLKEEYNELFQRIN